MIPSLSLRRYDAEVRAHDHEHAQLVFGLGGGLQLELDGRADRVCTRQAAVIPPACRHVYAGEGLCLVADVPVCGDWLGQALGAAAGAGNRLLDRPRVMPLPDGLDGLVRWLVSQPLADAALGSHAAALLLSGLSRPETGPACALPLAAIDAHIDRHAARPLQVADLAHLAGLSVSRLHQRFVRETGLTPMDYVRHRRLALGVDLLRQTSLAVGEIAGRVGYASQSAFTAALMRTYGQTPRVIRSARACRQKAIVLRQTDTRRCD